MIRGKYDYGCPSFVVNASKFFLSLLRLRLWNMKSPLITIPIVLVLFGLVSGYSLVDTVVGPTFYTFFNWEAIPDPTNGRVYVNFLKNFFFFSYSCRNYVDQATSRSAGLTSASSNSFILRADHKTVLSPSGPGRKSVRIKSVKTYTQHVAV